MVRVALLAFQGLDLFVEATQSSLGTAQVSDG
jgi:hypothetical protein